MKRDGDAYHVAVLWQSSSLRDQRILSGVCKEAGLHPGMAIQRFSVSPSESVFNKTLISGMIKWKPDGIICWYGNPEDLCRLKKMLPGVPIVSTNRLPAYCVDTVTSANPSEVMRVTRDHLYGHGARSIALYCSAHPEVAKFLGPAFLRENPQGYYLAQVVMMDKLQQELEKPLLDKIGSWLKKLPRPAGVFTLEPMVATLLFNVCHKIGLRVPDDVMILGVDDEDACLTCVPRLSSINTPTESIGAAAVKVLIQHMNGLKPAPPRMVLVDGTTIISRGSTARSSLGSIGIENAVSLIEKDLSREYNIPDLIRISSKESRSAFYKRFKGLTGQTPAGMLRQARLKEACRLLKHTSGSIASIAEACGFGNPVYFPQVFKREMKMTPSAYRKLNKKR